MGTESWNDSVAVITIKTIALSLFIIFAVLGNGTVIYSIYKFKKLKTVPNYFVFNLAIADFLFAVTGMPLIIPTTIAKEWILGDFMCSVSGLLNSLFCTVSIWTLVMISINRYFAVAKAQDIKKIYTAKRTYFLILFVWILSITIAIPPLVGWSEFVSGTNFCTVNGKKHLSYSIFLMMADYIFPMCLLLVMYLRIFFLLRKHEQKMKRKSGGTIKREDYEESSVQPDLDSADSETAVGKFAITKELSKKDKQVLTHFGKNQLAVPDVDNSNLSLSSSLDTDSQRNFKLEENHNEIKTPQSIKKSVSMKSQKSPMTSPKQRSSKKIRSFFKEARVTKMLMTVVLGFFICWTPFMTASVLYAFSIKPDEFRLLTFGIVIACLNSVINPIIYAVMNRNFRTAFQQIFKSLKSLCSMGKKN